MNFNDFVDGVRDVADIFGGDSFESVIKRARTGDAVAKGWEIAGVSLQNAAREYAVEQEKQDPKAATP